VNYYPDNTFNGIFTIRLLHGKKRHVSGSASVFAQGGTRVYGVKIARHRKNDGNNFVFFKVIIMEQFVIHKPDLQAYVFFGIFALHRAPYSIQSFHPFPLDITLTNDSKKTTAAPYTKETKYRKILTDPKTEGRRKIRNMLTANL
jgi:hypothetical protein